MFSLIAVVAFCSIGIGQTPQEQESLFEKYFPQPTGRNGYEEFLMAVDYYFQHPKRELVWQGARPEDYEDSEFLSTCLAVRDNFARVVELLRAANRKPFFDPREQVDNGTPYPELVGMKYPEKIAARPLAMILTLIAYAELATGDPDEAARITRDGLIYGHRLRSQSLLSDNYGRGVESYQLKFASNHIDTLAVAGYGELISCANGILEDTSHLTAHYQIWSDFHDLYLESAIDDINLDSIYGMGLQDWVTEIADLSRQQRVQLRTSIQRATYDTIAGMFDLFKRPEKEWTQYAIAPSGSELGDAVTSHFLNSIDIVFLMEVVLRTRLRLLRLHSLIGIFKWTHDRLPMTLEELEDDEAVDDPLSGAKFVYEMTDEGYDLYSKGNDDVEVVRLKWP